jgi:hypothetical protein
VDRFRRKVVAEADALRARIAAGERPMEDRTYRRRSDGVVVNRRQPRKPLSPRSINTLIQMLATLLDVAMERSDVDLAVNAARGRRRKIKVVQPTLRSFLEVDRSGPCSTRRRSESAGSRSTARTSTRAGSFSRC